MKQDQSTISAPELLRQTRCALLMIDTENRFFWENENGHPLPAAALLPNLQRLLHAARQGGILSVFIAVKHKSGTDSGPWLRRLALLRKGLPRMSRQYTPWGEGFPIALQPLEAEVVVEKMRMSGFFGTCLESYLRNHGIETLVMACVASNGARHGAGSAIERPLYDRRSRRHHGHYGRPSHCLPEHHRRGKSHRHRERVRHLAEKRKRIINGPIQHWRGHRRDVYRLRGP
jgi:isochorismate hydrolase